MKNIHWRRVGNSRLMHHTSFRGSIVVNPKQLMKCFGKPIPSLPDTHGEIIFVSSDKKVAVAFYDYKSSKNPWINKQRATLHIGAKNTALSRKYVEHLLKYLESLGILKA